MKSTCSFFNIYLSAASQHGNFQLEGGIYKKCICDPQECKMEKSSYYGRIFSIMNRGLKSSLERILRIVENIFFTLKVICGEPNAFAAVIRKLDEHVLALIEKIKKSPGEFRKLKDVMRSTLSWIDVLQIAADIDYGLKAKFKNDSKCTILGRLALFAAHIGTTRAWLSDMGFVKLDTISSALGKPPFFSMPMQVSLRYATARMIGVAYAFFALDALNRLLLPGNVIQKTIAKLELASNVSEVFLDILLIAGVVDVVCLGMMATICMSLGIGVLLYRENNKHAYEPLPIVEDSHLGIIK